MKPNKMMIILSYLAVIFIWSTTPLAIKWSSNENLDFISGLVFRMIIGASLTIVIALSWYKSLPINKQALKLYFASSIGIFGAMMLVYWGAQYIPSGLISVLYGFSPIITSILAYAFFLNDKLSVNKVIGGLLGIAGLYLIFDEQWEVEQTTFYGLLAVLGSVFFHALSAILLKKINYSLPALQLTAGGLGISMPMFILTYILFAEPLPDIIHTQTLFSILYLGIAGSVIGFIGYYYILSHLQVSTVALITLITPMCALYLGKTLNQEEISINVLWGSICILIGLTVHQLYPVINKVFRKYS